MFIPRLLSGIALILFMLLTVSAGHDILLFTMLLISLLGAFELLRVLKLQTSIPGMLVYAGTVLLYWFLLLQQSDFWLYGMTVMIFLLLMTCYVFSYPKYTDTHIFYAFGAFVYAAVLLSFVYRLREAESGQYLVWLIFIASWGCDTCAYCVGMLCKKLLGTHPMTPKLSPKKSVEGAVGGLIGAFLLGLLYGFIFEKNFVIFQIPTAIACGALCVCGGAVSMVGDLAASAIKRNHDIKDYGKLIPGHGGIMDRFDSILFVAPVIYYVAMLLS